MATLIQPRTEDQIKRLGVNSVKEAYVQLASDYSKIVEREVIMCPCCGEWMRADTSFYKDSNYVTDRYPICKRCIIRMVEQRKKKTDPPNETKESVQKVLQMMDKVYDDRFYSDCVKNANEGIKEKNRVSPFSTYITAIQSLTQWKGLTWKDSDFGDLVTYEEDELKVSQKLLKNAKKRFGTGYLNDEYYFLENEYQDWVTRYECNTKAQEEIFKNLSLNRLERKQAVKNGKPTKEIDKTFQELLATQNIQPRQTGMDTFSDAQTLGTLIQKYEETRPLPDIDPELEDVDKIGLYIDVFFRGHASKMLGLANKFTHIYERFMAKYTVNQPKYDEDEDSEVIFDKVFGSTKEE